MYTNRRYTTSVRDGGAAYGQDPVPEEAYPAAHVLDDLTTAERSEIPLIIARYAALRALMLRHGPGDAAVRYHAADAARAHLDAVPEAWPERALFERALTFRHAGRTLPLLEAAATVAWEMGHVHGAQTLRQAVHRVRWRRAGYPPPFPS